LEQEFIKIIIKKPQQQIKSEFVFIYTCIIFVVFAPRADYIHMYVTYICFIVYGVQCCVVSHRSHNAYYLRHTHTYICM